jgi:hypothetical protein
MLITGAFATAQVESGQIAGTVMDQSGAVVPGASVTITNIDTNAGRVTKTSSTGAFIVPGLAPATYQVTVTGSNFKPFTAKVEVTVGGRVTEDCKLSVSANTTEVQVVAEGGVNVNTQTQEISQVIDTQQLAKLPSLTRNPYDFVGISANVSSGDNTTSSSNSGQNLTNRGVGYAINGQRESGTEILLDGVENVAVFGSGIGENVPVDAVQEYSVITNNFSAEYGRASGGVVNVTTKAGTNKYHGSGWEFNRLAAYTANTYANDAANAAAGSIVAPKGQYTRNQFGFQGGGPILKNKLFIEEATEYTRVRSAATETEEIFDPAFIAMLPANAQAYFKAYGTGVSSTTVAATAGQLNAAGLAVNPVNGTTAVPATTPVFDTVNFTAPFDAGGGVPENAYSLVGRLDYNPTDKTQMFFRAGRESLDQFLGSNSYSAYSQYDSGTAILNQSYLYSLVHIFSTKLLASSKFSYTRYNTVNSFNAALTAVPNLMFVSPTDPVTGGTIQMPGLENFSEPGEGGLPYGGPQNTIQIEPDISWTKGKHSMRFGGTYTYIQMNVAYGAYAQAVEELGAGAQDSMNDLVNADGNAGGSQLVAFDGRVNPQGAYPCVANPSYWLTNSFTDLNQTSKCEVTPPLTAASYARSYRYNDWAFYGEDNYRITPRLTLNLGLRYEHYGVQHNNKDNLDSNFYPGSGSSIEAQVRSGNLFIANQSPVGQFWAPRWGTYAPRVGFAYDIFGSGQSSLRGGFGISYERNFGNVTYNASFNPPASAVLSSVCGAQTLTCNVLVTNNDLGPLGQPGPASPLPPAELRMPNPHIQVAQTQFWNLALQHQIVRGTVAQIGYVGTHSVHLYDIENINLLGAGQNYLDDPITFASDPDCPLASQILPGWYANNTTPPCFDRPNNGFSNINMRGSLGEGRYNALIAGVQTQNLHNTGIDLVANYTWGHSLDDLSSTFGDSLQGGSGYVGSLGYTNLADPKLDWGSSDYDQRQRLTVTPIWAIPWFKTGSAIEREALGGWTVSGLFSAHTGIPFSVFDYDNDYNYYTTPRLTPATPISNYHVGSPQRVGPNLYTAMNIPQPASFAPLNSTLGISDFGPYPSGMTHRNCFRGPGAWNGDMSVEKRFPITEGTAFVFRAEGFDFVNHHNYYVNTTTLAFFGPGPMPVYEEKGGLGTLATGGNHDERRFGQFSLRFNF